MECVTISGTNLQASRVGLGTWAIGGWMWGGTERYSPDWTKGHRYEPIAVSTSHHTCCEGKELVCADKTPNWETQPQQQGATGARVENHGRAGKTRW